MANIGTLKINTIRCREIDDEINRFWLELHENDPQLRSPNFHPNFTRAVAAVRDDVEVAVIRSGAGQLVGIFPFQRLDDRNAAPIGGRMNDYHGVMLAGGIRLDLETLLYKLGIEKFGFHAAAVNRDLFEDYKFTALPSYSVDLSDGYDRYMEWATRNSGTLKRMPQKIRALNRDHGPVRFEFNCKRDAVLEDLIQLKSSKYKRTNTFDILSVDWAANLLREIYRHNDSGFRGVLSVLWARDSIAAAHFGMIADDVLQYWFPAFDNRFAKYSPGLQLMMNTIRASSESGIRTIDLSYGQSKFKDLFANEDESVLFGQVNFNALSFQLAKQKYRFRILLKELPFKEPAKLILRKTFPSFGRWQFK